MATSTIIENTQRTFVATASIGAFLLTKIGNDGTVALAADSASEAQIGFTSRAADAGEATLIVLLNGGGTALATLSSTVTNAGTAVYAVASGKVAATATTSSAVLGYTVDAGGAADDVVEIILA
jgi:ABC-type phosphate/phosphonate transport system substrate-binding protein